MPKDKTESHIRIVSAAKKEFLEKGFEKASMRSIAAKVGMTSAGLYRHFKDKEAMFAGLVEPTMNKLRLFYETHKAWDYHLLEVNELDKMWESGGANEKLMSIIYNDFDVFKLLICCSAGTKYESFFHDFVMLEQNETLAFLDAAKKKGVPVKEINPKELHLLMSAYVTACFEVVVHDFTKEEAQHYLRTLEAFFIPGFRAVLGL